MSKPITVSTTITMEVEVDEAKEAMRDANDGVDKDDRIRWDVLKETLENEEQLRTWLGEASDLDDVTGWIMFAIEVSRP